MSATSRSNVHLVSTETEKRLRKLVESCLNQWSENWGLEATLTIDLVENGGSLFSHIQPNKDMTKIESCREFSCFTKSDSLALKLAQNILSCDEHILTQSDQAYMNKFGKQALSNLFTDLSSQISVSEQALDDPFVISYRVLFEDEQMYLYFTSSVVRQLRCQKVKRNHLVKVLPMEEGLDKKHTRILVALKTVKLSIKQLSSLTKGDVIPLQQNLNDPLSISVQSQQEILKGYLVKHQNKKSIILD